MMKLNKRNTLVVSIGYFVTFPIALLYFYDTPHLLASWGIIGILAPMLYGQLTYKKKRRKNERNIKQ